MPSEKQAPQSEVQSGKYVLVIHGGAGTMLRENSTPEKEAAYHAGLKAALEAGYKVLSEGGEAMDASIAAVSAMEDNLLFNAGRGAVFNTAGKVLESHLGALISFTLTCL